MTLRDFAGTITSAAGIVVVAAACSPIVMLMLPHKGIQGSAALTAPQPPPPPPPPPRNSTALDEGLDDEAWWRELLADRDVYSEMRSTRQQSDYEEKLTRLLAEDEVSHLPLHMRSYLMVAGSDKDEATRREALNRVLMELRARESAKRYGELRAVLARLQLEEGKASTPKLRYGRILFEPERTMQLRHAEVVMVRMDAGSSPDLKSGIDPKKYKVDSVKVGQRMRVHLDGNPPDAFEIVPMSPPDEQQAVTNISASTWMWNVTPKKNGGAALLLNIWALAKVEDSDTLVPLFQKTETIQVRGIPLPDVSAGSFWEKMLEKIAEHAGEGLWAAVGAALTALGGWIAKWWRKPKSAAAPAGGAATG
jgi:hypothetical protein